MLHFRTSIVASALVSACTVVAAQPNSAPIPEQPGAAEKLGYKTVASALEALKLKPGVVVNVTKPDGWVIITEPETKAMWSFTPEGHYAYPAVVRRTIKPDEKGNVGVEMVALCQASKEPCDQLIREFQQLNERLGQAVRSRTVTQGAK